MATITATKSGNWSDTAVWDLGRAPLDGDLVLAGGYAIELDVDVNQPDTVCRATTGYYAYSGGGTRNMTGVTFDGSTTSIDGLVRNVSAGTLNVGTVTGGAGNYAHGAYNIGSGTLNIDTATGGAGSNAYGASNIGSGTLNIDTATGGAGSNAYGASNFSAGTLNVGTATGGVGSNAYGAMNNAAGTLTIDLAVGNNWGVGGSGSYAYGVYGNGVAGQTTTVKRIQSGPYGAPAIGGAVLMVSDASNSCEMRTAYGGGTRTLSPAGAAADFPAIGDVRAGVTFDDGDLVGTCAVPAANQVSAGIPVDATVGTAVLTQAAVADALKLAPSAGAPAPGSMYDLLDTGISVDPQEIADAVIDALEGSPITAICINPEVPGWTDNDILRRQPSDGCC